MAKAKKKSKRLIEQVVQETAQAYLDQYYRLRHNLNHFYSNIEERTKKKYGMKRADGFLAYKKSEKKAYVISMEAKSHKTLPALRPYRVDKLWIKDSIYRGFQGTLLSGVLFLAWRSDGWMVFLPFLVWILLSLIYGFVRKDSYKYQEMQVVHQVFQYPANEQWLSLSDDSFEMIDENLRNNLFKICAARGIGVLMVDEKLNVRTIYKPVVQRKWFGDYLVYYHYENEIRKFLGIKLRPPIEKLKMDGVERRIEGESHIKSAKSTKLTPEEQEKRADLRSKRKASSKTKKSGKGRPKKR